MKDKTIIEAEEYQDGHFRESRKAPDSTSSKPHQSQSAGRPKAPKPHASRYYWTLTDTIFAGICTTTIVWSIVIRLIALLYYLLSRSRVSYDLDLSLDGLVSRFFWVWCNACALRFWMKHVQPHLPNIYHQLSISFIIASLISSVIGGYILHQMIFQHHFSILLTVGKVQLAASWIMLGVIVLCRVNHLLCAVLNGEEDFELAIKNFFYQFRA